MKTKTDKKAERAKKEQAYAIEIMREHDVPEPPTRFCKTCGAVLQFVVIKAKPHWQGKYDSETGKPRFTIDAEFVCPNGHVQPWGIQWWTNWKKGYNSWGYKEPFVLASVGID